MATMLNIFLFLLIATVAKVDADFLMKPQNVAVMQGGTASFSTQFEASDFEDLLWAFSKKTSPSSYTNVANAKNVYAPSTRPTFSVVYDSSSLLTTLTISNVMLSDAGNLRSQLNVYSLKAYAQLIVIESDPVCSTSVPVDPILEGETLNITCQVKTSAGINWYPQMTWSLSDGTSITPSYDLTDTLIQTSISEVVSRIRNGMTYQVITSFPALDVSLLPPDIPASDHSTNIPSYSFTYTTPSIVVQYPVSAITFMVEKTMYAVNESITCNSDGHPASSRKWLNGIVVIENSPVLLITANLIGMNNLTCEATQILNNRMYSVQKNLEFTVVSGPIINSCALLQQSITIMVLCLVVTTTLQVVS